MVDTKKALSVAEAAEALGITRQCLYSNLLHRKDFPSFKVGRRTLVSAEALDRWIAEQVGDATQHFGACDGCKWRAKNDA